MQTEEDRARIIEIGGESQKTRTVGNLKFDQTFPSFTSEGMTEMAKSLGLRGNESILIAGSTHSGEEEILVTLYKELKRINPHLVLVLAPRHLDRLDEVERILKKESLSWLRKTSLSLGAGRSDQERPDVILLDTMGELMSIYSLGTLVFVGGSLVPVGGHNPLEPLFFKMCSRLGLKATRIRFSLARSISGSKRPIDSWCRGAIPARATSMLIQVSSMWRSR
jgi:3-deoxy-D-manno-octulosonic-acid transferase